MSVVLEQDHDSRNLVSLEMHADINESCLISKWSDYKVYLTGHEERLLILDNNALLFKGDVLTRNLKFESTIINCFFTTFNQQKQSNISVLTSSNKKEISAPRRVLVIVLKEQIYVYEEEGRSQVISFPFHIKNAFSFENGLIINKEFETPLFMSDHSKQQMSIPSQIGQTPINIPTTSVSSVSGLSNTTGSTSSNNDGNFLTLLDALGELGSIVSSSTSSFSSREELVYFPKKYTTSIATTYNSIEKTITMYHIRYLSRSKSSKKESLKYQNLSRRSSKRTGSSSINNNMTATPSTSKIIEDPGTEMKQYRSASNAMSYDRMASGTEFMQETGSHYSLNSHYQIETSKLRKDVIFTKLNEIEFADNTKHLKTFNIFYEDQEAVVICNLRLHTIEFFLFNNSASVISLPSLESSYLLQGLDAVEIYPEKSGYIALLYDNFHIVLVNPFLGLLSPMLDLSLRFPPIKFLDDSYGSNISVYCVNSEHYTLNLVIKPQDKLIQTLMKSLKYLSNNYIYEYFWLQWCANVTSSGGQLNDDWKAFCITLLSLMIPEDVQFDEDDIGKNSITQLIPQAQQARKNNENMSSDLNSPGHYSLSELSSSIALSLHLIREDLRLNILAQDNVAKLSLLLAQLTSWMGWSDNWFKYYMQDPKTIDRQTRFQMAQPLNVPPNLFESLASLFTTTIVPYITFSQVSEEDDNVDEIITPRTYYVLRLFEVIVSPEFESTDIVNMMVDYGIKSSDLESYPAGVYLPLKNAIVYCQENISSQWNNGSSELELIGRKDLLAFSESVDFLKEPAYFKSHFSNAPPKEMSQILKFVNDNEAITAWDGQAEADKFHVTKLIFHEDRRFYELTRLLQTSKVHTATLRCADGMDDHEKLIEQRALGSKVALRTLTMPLGRGAVFLSSRKPLMTERFPIPKMNFNSLILPDMINVSLEKDSIEQDFFDWGFFHNGASSGLIISRDSVEVNGSWIVFNRPPTLNAQHAGFLLGLGLNGHLKKLEEWHIYNYLGPKHNFTSVGLLLGMAASLKGSMDVKLTKVLSVHVIALLPPGSTNLNVQMSVQTAGLIGIGLLYLETQHRRMTEVLLSQINSSLFYNEKEFVNEGYRLAAGIALGYVYLGKGENLKDTNDTHVTDQLFSLAVSLRDIQTSDEFDKSCGGAILALTFMFLKTNNLEIATKLSIPTTLQLLDYVRPDFLLLRCLGKNLVMWDSIESNKKWVEFQIPACVSMIYSVSSINHLNSDFLPYLNIIGGVLLSIAIKFASTSNAEAKSTLLYYFDKLMGICSMEATNYDEKMALIVCQNIRDVVIVGLSLVMAGSGDLDIFRRLRVLQGNTESSTNYGNYMAINTALGFLFLGGGQQAFRKDNFGIAALITAIYPVYYGNSSVAGVGNGGTSSSGSGTNNNGESLEIHLQALRHFWALAVENRCLVVRDVESKKAIKIDVDIVLKSGEVVNMSAPGLLPELDNISKIMTSGGGDEEYFPVVLNMDDVNILEKFKKNYTMCVYRKRAYQNSSSRIDSHRLETSVNDDNLLHTLGSLSIFNSFTKNERDYMLSNRKKNHHYDYHLSRDDQYDVVVQSTVFDLKLEIERLVKRPTNADDLWNLKLVFNFVDKIKSSSSLKFRRSKRKNKKRMLLDEISGKESDDELRSMGDIDDIDDIDNEGVVHQNGIATEGLNYLNVKFIERLKNDLWLNIQSGIKEGF
ncbi:hypothetical protein CANARDRAFT_30387 [[Candida] arabinofermentans NRRL YB-2248]|uniref:Anaphase-promoting complex subunit 1 N-terminal domain-containing protein n=1 Tax=[Candida] arabinofermentans NRRL YB-2248 TaxID=983967 RepID=A0A1E4SU56_9ASCO|nr:hypothetical protein CANARDRAFT_30387 [[Candida] arabinofermentans NRRL YB-2248]